MAADSFPRRLLMTADTVGGVFSYSIDLCRELAAGGAQILLATMGRTPCESQQKLIDSIPGVIHRASEFQLEWMPDPWRDVDAAGEWLLGLAQAFNPDLVHINGYAHAALPWSVPVVVVAHSCVVTWWRAVHGGNPPEQFERYRHEVSRGLAAASQVVTPTRAFLHDLESAWGPLPNTTVIPNGRHMQVPEVDKEPFIFAAGRAWDVGKNLRVLAEAAPLVPWPIRIAGEGGATGPFLGPVDHDNIAELFARASIYAHPALYEPFGLVVLEAALSGCALALSDLPSLRENWEGCALFFDPRRIWSVVDCLRELARDRGLRERLSERAVVRARDFTPAQMARLYRETYSGLRPAAVVQ